jgi:RNA polymerase sigma-70 factor (ECF subfamily)
MDLEAARLSGPRPSDAAIERVPAAAISPEARARVRGMFREHFAVIWRVLRRLGVPPQVVDDAAQEVFVVATVKIDSIEAGRERSYLLGSALLVAAEVRRGYARQREVCDDDTLGAAVCPGPGPEELTDRKHSVEVLDALLEELPPDLRAAFVLFEIEGLSTQEIAALAGIPRGTVASRLRRAREAFEAAAARLRARTAFRGGLP